MQANSRLAEACCFIFLFTFLLGTNFDYRLVFLLPVVLQSLKEFEASIDYRKLVFPVLVTSYLWLTPLNSLTVDLISMMIFASIFSTISLGLMWQWRSRGMRPKTN